jgi:SAM-dependent methyltransferase
MYLWQFDRAQLARSHVLEIGCGVGRLARHLAPLCASYTGIDIAPGMLETARARTADLPNLRFLENDGVSLPELARDRSYALALAAAVFIHCPRDVIAALMRCAWNQLESGGELRFQLLADPSDLTGLGTGPNTQAHLERTHAEQLECNSLVTSDIRELIDGHAYMGDQFRFDDVAPFVRRYLGVDPELVRMTPQHIYGWVVKV